MYDDQPNDPRAATEPFDHTIEHARADMADKEIRDKSPHEIATYRQQDLLESLDSSVRQLEKRLRPILRQTAKTSPDSPALASRAGSAAVNDNTSPVVQMVQSQNERTVSILAHLNNIIDALEI